MVYTTKQQQAVLHCLEQRPEEALTATDLAADLREAGHPVGLATIYRQLEKLEAAIAITRMDAKNFFMLLSPFLLVNFFVRICFI